MRAILQRVSRAAVQVNGALVGEIGAGYLMLLGITHREEGELKAELGSETFVRRTPICEPACHPRAMRGAASAPRIARPETAIVYHVATNSGESSVQCIA